MEHVETIWAKIEPWFEDEIDWREREYHYDNHRRRKLLRERRENYFDDIWWTNSGRGEVEFLIKEAGVPRRTPTPGRVNN